VARTDAYRVIINFHAGQANCGTRQHRGGGWPWWRGLARPGRCGRRMCLKDEIGGAAPQNQRIALCRQTTLCFHFAINSGRSPGPSYLIPLAARMYARNPSGQMDSGRFRFGVFEFDAASRELRRECMPPFGLQSQPRRRYSPCLIVRSGEVVLFERACGEAGVGERKPSSIFRGAGLKFFCVASDSPPRLGGERLRTHTSVCPNYSQGCGGYQFHCSRRADLGPFPKRTESSFRISFRVEEIPGQTRILVSCAFVLLVGRVYAGIPGCGSEQGSRQPPDRSCRQIR